MKILIRITSFLILTFVAIILFQNVDYSSNIQILDKFYPNIKLPIILIITSAIGFLSGAFIISLIALQYRTEVYKSNKRIKGLMTELDSLRNLSIEDISLDDLNIDDIKPVQIPLIEKPSTPIEEK